MYVVCSPFTSWMQLRGIPVSVPGLARHTVPLTVETGDPRLRRLAQFRCEISPFRINTCESVSKQTTLTPFRINTSSKTGGAPFWHSSHVALRSPLPSRPFFSNCCALFCTFLRSAKTQPLSFQIFPHSFTKTRGVGNWSAFHSVTLRHLRGPYAAPCLFFTDVFYLSLAWR